MLKSAIIGLETKIFSTSAICHRNKIVQLVAFIVMVNTKRTEILNKAK
jgi:hypothetical protein